MTTSAAASPKQSSFIEDIVDVFYAPSAVFERRRNRGFGLALLLYAVLNAAMLYAARPVMQPMIDKQIAQTLEKMSANPSVSAEQRTAMEKRMRGMADSPLALIGPVVALPVVVLLTAAVLWLAGKAVGSVATYGQAAMVTTFAAFPRLLLMVLMTAFAIATGREVTSQYAFSISPAALLGDDASPIVAALLSRLDLGTLWMTALLGIGIAVVGRVSRGKGLTAAAITWLVGGVAVLVGALRQMAG